MPQNSVFRYWNALTLLLGQGSQGADHVRPPSTHRTCSSIRPLRLRERRHGSRRDDPLPIVHASDKQDGGKVSLRRGQKLRLVLHSTYWELKAVSAPAVLRLVGAPVVNPKSGCVPGQGCGTVDRDVHREDRRLSGRHRRADELRRGDGLHRRGRAVTR